MKEELIRQIVEKEWVMFQSTENTGGRAWCQDDRMMFDCNRMAQFSLWDEGSLTSYLNDLKEAEEKGVNLISLKYAYMMERTWPDEYLRIKDQIPVIREEALELIDPLVEMTVAWGDDFAARYPEWAKHARPIHKEEDRAGVTSVETYARGELSTYSADTLKSLQPLYRSYKEENQNMFEQTVKTEMQLLKDYRN